MIPFLSFDHQQKLLGAKLLKKAENVLDSKYFVLGNEVNSFEKKFANLLNTKHAIGVGSGLDALIIALRAIKIMPGDEIIVPSNTYIATWLAISQLGAKIVPVEPDIKTYNIDPLKIEEKITSKTKVIMPVHLYGQACDMVSIMKISKKYNLFVVEDNAQAQLATFGGQFTGTFGIVSATSFYPTKNLGAIGEAGCITTESKKIMKFCRAYRNYGSEEKYINKIKGINSRIDEIQAAFLNVKIDYLKEFTDERRKQAEYYNKNLPNMENCILPYQSSNSNSVFHLYVIQTPKREKLQQYLLKNNIGTAIHYPIPPHLQKAYKELNFKKGDFPISEYLAKNLLSIPLYPGLKKTDQDYIIETISHFVK